MIPSTFFKSCILCLTFIATIVLIIPSIATSATKPLKTVRVFWVKPSDVAYDQRFPDGIKKVILEAQRYYFQELGKTFILNDPVVEIDSSSHPASWFYSTPNGNEPEYYAVFNGYEELQQKFGVDPQFKSRWMVVEEVSASSATLDQQGCGGGGWVFMSKHEADGSAGLRSEPMSRWYGGMVHEMGHAWGLGDGTEGDGSPMSGAFYGYPNCHFRAAEKTSLLNNATYKDFWSATALYEPSTAPQQSVVQWKPAFKGDDLIISRLTDQQSIATIALYDLSGKQIATFTPSGITQNRAHFSFPVKNLRAGSYVCTFDNNRGTEYRTVLRKNK